MRWRFQQLELRWYQGDGFINNSSLLFHFLATWHAVSSARRYLYQKPIQLPITTKQQIKIFQSPPLQGVEAQSFCNTEMQKAAEETPIEGDFWPTKNEWLMYLRLMVTSTLVHPMADLWLWLLLFQKHVSSLDFMKLIHSRQGMKYLVWKVSQSKKDTYKCTHSHWLKRVLWGEGPSPHRHHTLYVFLQCMFFGLSLSQTI